MNTPKLPNTWYVMGYLRDSNKILTCYGLEELESIVISQRLKDSGLVYKIDIVHSWRNTPRGRWQRTTHQFPMGATDQRPAVTGLSLCVPQHGLHSRENCRCSP